MSCILYKSNIFENLIKLWNSLTEKGFFYGTIIFWFVLYLMKKTGYLIWSKQTQFHSELWWDMTIISSNRSFNLDFMVQCQSVCPIFLVHDYCTIEFELLRLVFQMYHGLGIFFIPKSGHSHLDFDIWPLLK